MTRQKTSVIISVIISVLAGIVFISSAIAKLISVDHFELYIFSQKIIGFHLSTLAARLIISAELVLGVLLLAGFYYRTIRRVTIVVLGLFSIFLLVKLIVGSTENCNCFGTMLMMGPLESLIKNVILIVLLAISTHRKPLVFRGVGIITAAIIILSIAVPMIISAPDILYIKVYTPVDRAGDSDYLQLSDTTLPWDEGARIVLFSSPACYYCRLTAKKLSISAERTGTDDRVLFYFFGDDEYVENFWEQSEIDPFPYAILPTAEIITLTDGLFPTLMFLEDGKILKRSGYRDFAERDLVFPPQ